MHFGENCIQLLVKRTLKPDVDERFGVSEDRYEGSPGKLFQLSHSLETSGRKLHSQREMQRGFSRVCIPLCIIYEESASVWTLTNFSFLASSAS
jgi:hypothetical protein